MRTNLITHFYCNECGHQLEVEYDSKDSPKKKSVMSHVQTDNEPSGAYCRYNKIFVAPCRHCIEKEIGPARQLSDAIRALAEKETE